MNQYDVIKATLTIRMMWRVVIQTVSFDRTTLTIELILMFKTNTSYFTGSSQLNKDFFFIFVTPSEMYIHMAA